MNGSSRASVAACALLAAMPAFAADLPRRTAPVDYYAPVAAPIFSWTGLYVGLNFGAGFGSFSQGSDQLFGKPTGVLGGLTVGYNQQIAPNFVAGVEADVDATSIRGAVSLPFFLYGGNARVSTLSTIRGRAGYSLDRALFYVTGGLAIASMNAYVNDWRTRPFFGSQSSTQAGFTIGGGLEYMLTNNLSAKVEYLYTTTSNRDYFAATPDFARLGVDLSTLKAGVNYHF